MPTPTDIINTATTNLFIKGRWENFKKMNPFFGILDAKGHIITGESGQQLYWLARAGTYAPTITSDYADQSANYVPNKQYIAASLPWAETAQFDAVSKGEFAKNDGDSALVKLRDFRMPDMVDDLINRSSTSLSYQILQTDGSSYAGTGLPIYGLPTIFQSSGGSAGSKDATSNGTYGGQALATSGITSVTNPVSNAWTPQLTNATATTFGSGASEKNNVLEYLSYTMRQLTFDGNDPTQRPTCGITNGQTYDYARAAIGAKQTIFLQTAVSADDAWGVGTSVQYFVHDGVKFYWDSNMPASTTYVLNMDQMWFHSLKVVGPLSGDTLPGAKPGKKDMFDAEVNYNDQRRAMTISITWRGQLRANPRFQGKIYPYA